MVSIRLIKRIDPSFAQVTYEDSVLNLLGTLHIYIGLRSRSSYAATIGVGYSIIANGGFYIKPYFIDRIVDSEGRLVRKYEPIKAGDENFV